MTSILLFTMLSLVDATSSVQTRPDLSGTWQMDLTRSESAAQGESIGPTTMVITQTANEIRIETTNRRGTIVDVYLLTAAPAQASLSTADPGAEAARAQPTTPLPKVARWRGETLLVDAVREVRGQTVTTQRELTLGANGNELVVQSTVNVQHGYTISGAQVYGTGKDVFVRQPVR